MIELSAIDKAVDVPTRLAETEQAIIYLMQAGMDVPPEATEMLAFLRRCVVAESELQKCAANMLETEKGIEVLRTHAQELREQLDRMRNFLRKYGTPSMMGGMGCSSWPTCIACGESGHGSGIRHKDDCELMTMLNSTK